MPKGRKPLPDAAKKVMQRVCRGVVPPAPAWLGQDAAAYFNDCAKQLHGMGALETLIDAGMLAIYCDVFIRYRDAARDAPADDEGTALKERRLKELSATVRHAAEVVQRRVPKGAAVLTDPEVNEFEKPYTGETTDADASGHDEETAA